VFGISFGVHSATAEDRPNVTADPEEATFGTGYLPTPPELISTFLQTKM
jgi:hypothetical protein